jgi:hypothetical protein
MRVKNNKNICIKNMIILNEGLLKEENVSFNIIGEGNEILASFKEKNVTFFNVFCIRGEGSCIF